MIVKLIDLISHLVTGDGVFTDKPSSSSSARSVASMARSCDLCVMSLSTNCTTMPTFWLPSFCRPTRKQPEHLLRYQVNAYEITRLYMLEDNKSLKSLWLWHQVTTVVSLTSLTVGNALGSRRNVVFSQAASRKSITQLQIISNNYYFIFN